MENLFLWLKILFDKKILKGKTNQQISKMFRNSDHSFSTYAKFSEKLTFLTRTCSYQGVRNASFFGNFCVRTKWLIPNKKHDWVSFVFLGWGRSSTQWLFTEVSFQFDFWTRDSWIEAREDDSIGRSNKRCRGSCQNSWKWRQVRSTVSFSKIM